jgi:hypothetical protein
VLACGPGAMLSHRTAADALGLLPSTSSRIEVIIRGRSRRRVPGLVIHRPRGLTPEDCRKCEGIPCTSAARTLLDLADVLSHRRLLTAIEAAERLGVYDARAVTDALDLARGRPAAQRLRSALADYTGEPPPTRTELERRALELFETAGLPRPRINSFVRTAVEPLEVDFFWPDRSLIVEADSFEWHRSRARFEEDRRRDQLLLAAGYAVVRVTWRQLIRDQGRLLRALSRVA